MRTIILSEVKKKAPEEPKEQKSMYHTYKPRGGFTMDKVKKHLRKVSSSTSNATLNKGVYLPKGRISTLGREVRRFDSAQELADHLFYHGTGGYVDGGLKPGGVLKNTTLGGGYGEPYHTISLSKSKNLASNFTGDSRSGAVYIVLLKRDAKVIKMPHLTDSEELEDILPELWNRGVDAVELGDWSSDNSEQELAVINPKAIVRGGYENFAVFKKEKFLNPTMEEIQKFYDLCVNPPVTETKKELTELKFKNLPQENSVVSRWEKLPDNYKNFFLSKGKYQLMDWLSGFFMSENKVPTEIGMTFKIINYLIEHKELNSIHTMYRVVRIPYTEKKTEKYFHQKIDHINKNGGLFVTSNKQYQSWTNSFQVAEKFYKTILSRNPKIDHHTVIFEAPVQYAQFYIPDLYHSLVVLNDNQNLEIESLIYFIKAYVDDYPQHEIVIKVPNKRLKVNKIYDYYRDQRPEKPYTEKDQHEDSELLKKLGL